MYNMQSYLYIFLTPFVNTLFLLLFIIFMTSKYLTESFLCETTKNRMALSRREANVPRIMRTVGIVTGISHVSGADYYIQLNDKVQSQLPTKYAGYSSKIALFSVNLEEYVEYLTYGRYDMVNALLSDAADRVIKAGADFLVLASNTAHMTIPTIKQQHPYFPILHIADCCAMKLKEANIKCIGLVGTAHTMKGDYIVNRLKQHGLKVVVPKSEEALKESERIIEKELSFNKFIPSSRKFYVDLIKNDLVRQQGAQGCILGCTEIELLVKQKDIPSVPLFNSAQIHIDAAVEVQLCRKNVWDFEPKTQWKCRL